MQTEPWSIVILGLMVAGLIIAALETLADWYDRSMHAVVSVITTVALLACIIIQLGLIQTGYGLFIVLAMLGGMIGGFIVYVLFIH